MATAIAQRFLPAGIRISDDCHALATPHNNPVPRNIFSVSVLHGEAASLNHPPVFK